MTSAQTARFQLPGIRPFTTVRPIVSSYPVTRTYYSGGGDDGQYHPDDSGAYRPDGSGGYEHRDNPYSHINGPDGGSGGGVGGAGGSGGFGSGYRDRS